MKENKNDQSWFVGKREKFFFSTPSKINIYPQKKWTNCFIFFLLLYHYVLHMTMIINTLIDLFS